METHLLHEIEKLSRKYDYNAFKADKLSQDIQKDIVLLKQIYDYVKTIKPSEDDKLLALLKLMRNMKDDRKILVFTQYTDTANYLYENLEGYFTDLKNINSKTKNINSIVRRFAPISNNHKLGKNEKEIKILITTDVLSEGLNLQDCDLIINYDLHWNPVRLIQRMGRIDRIGALSEKILAINFLPEKKLEEKLGLKEKLRKRIDEIHKTIGEDTEILEKDENLNDESMYAIYTGDSSILDGEEDDDELSMVEIEEIVRILQKDNPDYYAYIKNLPDGIRSAMNSDLVENLCYLMMEANDTYKLLLTDRNGKIVNQNLIEVLNHIRCERTTKKRTLPKDYNTSINNAKGNFEKSIRQIEAAQKDKGNLPGTVRDYLVREFQVLYHNSKSEDRKNNIQLLTLLLNKNLPEIVVKEIRNIKQKKLTGEDLLLEFEKISGKYRLSRYLEPDIEQDKPSKAIPKIVCSEALL